MNGQTMLRLTQLLKAANQQSSIQQCRHISMSVPCSKRVVFTSRPVSRGTERRILNAVTTPIMPPDMRPPEVKCFDHMMEKKASLQSEMVDMRNKFLRYKIREIIASNNMIAICHQLPLNVREYHNLKVKIFQGGMRLEIMRNDLALEVVENTKLRNLKPYFTSSTTYLVSPEPNFPNLMKILKKCPEIQLLGGLVEDRIMSKEDMVTASKLHLDTLRGELLTILKSPATKTHRMLGKHQADLSGSLTQLVKQGEGREEA